MDDFVYISACIFVGVITGMIVQVIAEKRGFDTKFPWWFIFGMFLFIVALPVVLITTPDKAIIEKRQLRSGKTKKCHACAEIIKSEANICRYCQTTQASATKAAIDTITSS